jgi:4-hydroxybutyrate CoA-transferase
MSASQALDEVHSGDRVWIQSGCGTSSVLVDALVAHAPHVRDVEVVHMMTLGSADYTLPEYEGHFRHRRSALSTGTGRFCSARPLS